MLKKTLLIVPVVVLLGAGAVYAAVAGTPHDLSAGTAINNADTEVDGQTCIFCHTPHSANTAGGPLWNRTVSSAPATYTLYSSSTMNSTPSDPPGGVSLACLSCHDGQASVGALLNVNGAAKTVAVTVLGTAKAIYTSGAMSGGVPFIGQDLSNDHPVGIDYAAALAGGGFKAVAAITLPLYSGAVECGTCHNPHDDSNGNFLRMANNGSALCNDCHTY